MVVGMEGQGGLKQPRMKQAFDKLLNWQRGAVLYLRLQAWTGRKLEGRSWMQRGHVQSILPCPHVGSGALSALGTARCH